MEENFKDLDDIEFVDLFYNKLKIKSEILTHLITIMPKKNHGFEETDLSVLIVLSLVCMQKVKAIELLVNEEMYLSASDQVRGVVEALRLTKLLALDKDYLELYKRNNNTDFRNTRDKKFMQSEITKRLEEIYKETKAKEKEDGIYTGRIEYGIKNLIKGSVVSEQHSILSKFAALSRKVCK